MRSGSLTGVSVFESESHGPVAVSACLPLAELKLVGDPYWQVWDLLGYQLVIINRS